MKVYVKPADGVVLTPTGDGSSAQVLKSYTFYGKEGQTIDTGLIPTEITSATEKSKNGSRRTMIKVATTMPKAVVDLVSAGNNGLIGRQTATALKDLRVQTHLVCECDEDLVRQSTAIAESDSALDESGVGVILATQLRAIAAIVEGDKSVALATSVLPLNGAVVRGLLGLEPLDVVNGTYGQATA